MEGQSSLIPCSAGLVSIGSKYRPDDRRTRSFDVSDMELDIGRGDARVLVTWPSCETLRHWNRRSSGRDKVLFDAGFGVMENAL